MSIAASLRSSRPRPADYAAIAGLNGPADARGASRLIALDDRVERALDWLHIFVLQRNLG